MGSFDQLKLEVQHTTEQGGFEIPSCANFIKDHWFPKNKFPVLNVVDRTTWQEMGGKKIQEEGSSKTPVFYIPEDLRLWEIVPTMEAMESEISAGDLARRYGAQNKIPELGEIFQNAGAYIYQRKQKLPEGEKIAHDLSQQLHRYGYKLINGENPKTFSEIIDRKLSDSENDEVERLLLGDKKDLPRPADAKSQTNGLYQQRTEEINRQERLNQLFRFLEKTFILKGESGTVE